MKIEPLHLAIQAGSCGVAEGICVFIFHTQGQVFSHSIAASLAKTESLILLCGRYEGIDERLIELEVDAEISIGDYVLSGGELPAMVVMDAICRLLPGVLGDPESAEADSFATGILDHPHYTRPANYQGREVPRELLSGDHKRIAKWREEQARKRTCERRPDLVESPSLT